MAHNHMRGYRDVDGVDVVGAVDTSPDGLSAFADEWGIGKRFGTLDAALAWGKFDAVDNITPDSIHHPTTLAVIETSPSCTRRERSSLQGPSAR